jgi:uncharacterized protein with PIN domain
MPAEAVSQDRDRSAFCVRIHFNAELQFFLPRSRRQQPFERLLREKTSLKDAIEACGVPHPEIGSIICNGVSVDFDHVLSGPAVVDVRGPDQPMQLPVPRFVADGHLGRLARDLRLLGFDVKYESTVDDHELARIAAVEERALLTRDRRLLMHKRVRYGYCPRSDDPDKQIIEVLRRFDLSSSMKRYTRCLSCNGMLADVAKADVLTELAPLTRRYYERFRRCSGCGKIYWSGSHHGRLQARVAEIRAALEEDAATHRASDV